MTFKVGDRVRITEGAGSLAADSGWEGEVIIILQEPSLYPIGVRFDEEYTSQWLHDCATRDPDNVDRCLWVAEKELELLNDETGPDYDIEGWERLLDEELSV